MERSEKGKSLLDFPASYTVVDVETTGYDPRFDALIEIAAIKMREGKEVARYETLVNPERPIGDFIEKLTGLTSEELDTAPVIADCLPDLVDFVQDDIIVAHNANFDINFLYDALVECGYTPLKNDFVDTLRISRIVRPELEHHRLQDLAEVYGIPQPVAHRSLADCQTTVAVLAALAQDADEKRVDFNTIKKSSSGNHASGSKVAGIVAASPNDAKPWNPLYKKQCVFTGKLEALTRKEAAQLVVNLGGFCGDNVTKKTNFLVMGSNEYNPQVVDGKSNKQKKAEALILKGADLQVLSEAVFLEMLED